jgi:pimeloyl-ACP methyl ester carboxylesterase
MIGGRHIWHTERRRLRIGPVDIAYRTVGTGPPLLLLHGLAGSVRWWRHNVPALAMHFQLYLVDLIGFGDSRGRQRFILNEAADHLVVWMDMLGLPQVAVIGHSMGGLIATQLVAACPNRVTQLVLVNAPIMPLGRLYGRHAGGLFGLLPSLRADFMPVLVSDTWRAGPFTMFDAIVQLLAADIRDRLDALRTPTLLVWGDRDTLVPLGAGIRLHERLAGSRLQVLPGAGHNPMWERPDEFNQAVLTFLQQNI